MSDRTILLVDDDPDVRQVVTTILETDGHTVVEAADGQAALTLLDSILGRGPDLVILDVMMPGLDGIEVCRQIDHERMKVMMLSAKTDDQTQAEARDAGADHYMTKPFSASELLQKVRELLPG